MADRDKHKQSLKEKILASQQRVKGELATKKESPERAAAAAAAAVPVVAPAAKKPKLLHDTLETAADKLEIAAQDEIRELCSRSDAEKKLDDALGGLTSVYELFPDNVKNLPMNSNDFPSYIGDVSKFANSPNFCAVMANLRETVKFANCSHLLSASSSPSRSTIESNLDPC